jgi:hypothetical protein
VSRFTIRGLAASFAMLAIAACSKGDAPPADSAAASAKAASAPVPLVGSAAPARPAGMPGALTKPLASYTGDEFYQLVQGQNYTGGHDQERKCKNDPGCGGTRRTLVTVDAIATQDSLTASNVPEFGVVYVRAVNKGDAEEARYNLLPFRDRYQYYLIVTKDNGGNSMRWTLEQLDLTPNARAHTTVGTGKFNPCPTHSYKPGAQANFKTCAQAAAAHDSLVHLGLVLQSGEDPPIWASCGTGCCVADNGA